MPAELERLQPEDARPPHEWLAEVRPRDRAPDDRPFVYLNMVSTVDGRAAIDGRSHALGSETDTLLLTELRALADAVLIGTGTRRAEGYGLLTSSPERLERRRAAGLEPVPTAILLSRSFNLPWEAGLFAAKGQRVLIYTQSDAEPPPVAADVEVIRGTKPSGGFVPAALADLRARGVRALLCEGGPTLNRALLEARAVDELFLTLSPLLAGNTNAPRIVEGDDLPEPLEMELAWILRHDHELYLRYRIR
jgi:riboflavin biosynthesis pyrimidine reductase